jgi:Rho-binding antiterminator
VKTYRPIDCELHDALEFYATRRELVDIVFLDAFGGKCRMNTAISDIYSRNGEEFLKTQTGHEVRLDRLKSVGAVLFITEDQQAAMTTQSELI